MLGAVRRKGHSACAWLETCRLHTCAVAHTAKLLPHPPQATASVDGVGMEGQHAAPELVAWACLHVLRWMELARGGWGPGQPRGDGQAGVGVGTALNRGGGCPLHHKGCAPWATHPTTPPAHAPTSPLQAFPCCWPTARHSCCPPCSARHWPPCATQLPALPQRPCTSSCGANIGPSCR